MSGLSRARLARAAASLNKGTLPSLILMTDDERLRDPLAAAMALPKGSAVVIRSRDTGRREALVRALLRIAKGRRLTILIAGDYEMALRHGVGFHAPEADLIDIAAFRRRSGTIVTASAHSERALSCAKAAGARAVLMAPIFPTKSHDGAGAIGAPRFRLIALRSCLPLYALGGVDARNAGRLAEAPLAGLAAIGALSV